MRVNVPPSMLPTSILQRAADCGPDAFAAAAEEALSGIDGELLDNGAFLRHVLENSGDCIKVLDLEARMVFMSAGGRRVMEIDDFSAFVGCQWLDFWKGENAATAKAAIATAKAGGLGRFQGAAPTAKGKMRWWDVQLSPINGLDGQPRQLLSISRDITELKRAEDQQILLVSEMQHRIKNLLTLVHAIATQTFRENSAAMRAARDAFVARIVALGAAHDVLSERAAVAADICSVVTGVLAPHAASGCDRFHISGPEATLGARQTVALTLILHELATNAVKYGALSCDTGHVSIDWRVQKRSARAEPHFVLQWRERGGPTVVSPTHKGFGSLLIERSMAADLGGRVQIHYKPAGLQCAIEAPLGTPAAQA